MSHYVNPLTDYSPQFEVQDASARGAGTNRSDASIFSEDEELELASELLEVSSQRDLDGYIDELVGRASRAAGGTIPDPVQHDLGDIFKGIAKTLLPVAGGALGFFAGGPAGAALGSSLASTAGHALGLELEGLSPEDAEFEAARQFVKFAGSAVQNALGANSPQQTRLAVQRAAETHAPGLTEMVGGPSPVQRAGQEGRPAQSSNLQQPYGGKQMEAMQRSHAPGNGNGSYAGAGRPLSEEEQTDLAAQLMEAETEEDFEGWLDSALGAAKSFLGSSTGKALTGALKDAAKAVLPTVAEGIGSAIAGPIGGQVGSTLGSAATNLFEAEAEAEEREWDAANVFVRVTLDAANRAASAPPDAHPHEVARHAVTEALRRHAPEAAHLFERHHRAGMHHRGRRHHGGHWVRHGNTIVIHGI
ncbi:MAG TPA: hypothetical protein VMB73_34985 [Acetobacteraceae bacterium]|nr:hypothetical protein [Acetobacteraceae bacterium]